MSSMQKLVASYKDKNLVLRIVTGLIIGAILGFAGLKIRPLADPADAGTARA